MTVAPSKARNYLVAKTKRAVSISLLALIAAALASNSVLARPAVSVVSRSITCHRTPSTRLLSDIRNTMGVPHLEAKPQSNVAVRELQRHVRQ